MTFLKTLIPAAFFLLSCNAFAQKNNTCTINEEVTKRILEQVEKKNPDAIKALPECFKLDRKLMIKVVLIDPAQFKNTSNILKDDENFVRRLLKVSPKILQYVTPRLRNDKAFMEHATYLSRDALEYADPRLLNNKLFMRKMITIDSHNYVFAAERLKELPEFAEIAFSDDGLLLAFAPKKIKADKKLVMIAVKSNNDAFEFAEAELKKDKAVYQLVQSKSSIKKDHLEKVITENYIVEEKRKNLGRSVGNKAKFFEKYQLINRNYITKWQKSLIFSNEGVVGEDLRLISADSRNYPITWKEDFRKHPDLIKKIEKFFLNHKLDKITIENLQTTYFWKIKSKPLTFAFNIYLLRDSKDADLGPEFSDVTSLTAIVQKHGEKWKMSVVEVIFDSEIKVDVSYPNGHKKYVLWDLYLNNKKDKNPKLIFKVEDRFTEYFEVFEEQSGGKYLMVARVDPLAKNREKEVVLTR